MVRFAGNYVAFVAFAESSDWGIGVMNMRTGRRLDFTEEVTPIELPPQECPSAVPHCKAICPQVDSLVLKPDGAVAWIATNYPAPSRKSGGVFCGQGVTPRIELRRHDRRGLRVLDSGPGILPESLRLSGSTLRWVDEGKRSATLL